MSVGTSLRVRTHGKVNLFLRVLGPRPDGFHEIETILHVIGLYDEIDMAVTDTPEVTIEMTPATPYIGEIPASSDNLITRAANLLRERTPAQLGADIRVTKNIPIGAGLGGGSSNAAGTLSVLSEQWSTDLEHGELHGLARLLGSDVPFCIDGGTALAKGRGEILTSLPTRADMWFVLGGTAISLSTRAVYSAWDDIPSRDGPRSAPMALAVGAGDVGEVAAGLHNDLEPAAFALFPELEAKKAAMATAGALGAIMTGSGPTIFGLAADEKHARSVAARVGDVFDWVRVVSSSFDCIERVDP